MPCGGRKPHPKIPDWGRAGRSAMATNLLVDYGWRRGARAIGTWNQPVTNPSGRKRPTNTKGKGIGPIGGITEKRTEAQRILVLHSSSGGRIRLPPRPAHGGRARGPGRGTWDLRATGPTMYGCARNRVAEVQRARRSEVGLQSDPVCFGRGPAISWSRALRVD
jgi:hypothetical protein